MVRQAEMALTVEQKFETGDRVKTSYGQNGRVSTTKNGLLLIALDSGGFICVTPAEVQFVSSDALSFSRHIWRVAPALSRPTPTFGIWGISEARRGS